MFPEYFERRLSTHLAYPQGLYDHGSNQARIAHRGERNKMSTTWKVGIYAQATRHLHRKTCFADAAWSSDRDQPHPRTKQQLFGGSHLLLASHKSGPLRWKSRSVRLHVLGWLLREAVAYGRENRGVAYRRRWPYRRGSGNSRGTLSRFPLDAPQDRANIGCMLESLLAIFFQRPSNDCVQSGR